MALSAQARQWLLLLTALLILGGVIAFNQFQDYQRIDAQERERLSALVDVAGKNIVPQIVLADRIISNVINALPAWQAENDGLKRANRELGIINDTINGIPPLLVMNASGTVIVSSNPKLLGMNFAYRDYFKNAVKNPDPKILQVSAPFKTVLNDFAFTLLRTIKGPGGEFAGIVVVTEVPAYFTNLLDSIRYSPDMWTGIVHGDGQLFLISPDRPGIVGRDLAKPGTLFSRHRQSGALSNVYSGFVYATGENRMIAMRTIQLTTPPMDKPLVVEATRDLEALFAPWRQGLLVQSVLFGLLAAFAVLGLWTLQRRRREQLAERQQAESRIGDLLREQRLIFDNAHVGIAMVRKRQLTHCNQRMAEIFGYDHTQQLVGKNAEILYASAEDFKAVRSQLYPMMEKHGYAQGEVEMRRSDGTGIWIMLTGRSINPATLADGSIWVYTDISERKKADEKINELAFFDQLTGLPNRTLLLDRLKQAITASSRSGSFGALLLIDLDNFKALNDSLGHDMGDLLLKQVAQRLIMCVREGDTVARLGGDEFVLVLPGLGLDEREAAASTEVVTAKILATLTQSYQLGTMTHHSTASIGVAMLKGGLVSIDDLMKQADLTMYKAKAAGRNAVRFFDPAMEQAVMARVALEQDLRLALQEQQFLLHYQAQVVGDGQVTGVEVLARWAHPSRGMIQPFDFIPLAEETGLILPLGHWVLETACRQLAAWAKQPKMFHLTVSVNVSAQQFRQTGFVEQVLEVLKNTGANPQRLKLELTESLLVENVQEVIGKMYALKAKGVGFSLDDFGTGYSSLSYLRRLPLDQLKIDQSFVRDVLSDANDAAIARTIVALAKSLGLGVIAEGVETAAQRDFLAEAGCHAYQGYFFTRPLPVAEFEAYAVLE